jgi:hypothetical protein
VVVVARLLVLRDHLLALLLRHPTILSGGPSGVHGGFEARCARTSTTELAG